MTEVKENINYNNNGELIFLIIKNENSNNRYNVLIFQTLWFQYLNIFCLILRATLWRKSLYYVYQ